MSSKKANWRDQAACASRDSELFFPIGSSGPALNQIEQARQVCGGCPVHTPCLEWALQAGVEYGVWGGLSEEERRPLRRTRQSLNR
jgi:WhiB family transcriptional regulator, redox-sensing transcriptional regulator